MGNRALGALRASAPNDTQMIYLMRHADAVSDEEDPARPLSRKGREQVARVCAVLRKNEGFKPSQVWHSPLFRSRETAELLAKGLELKAPLMLVAGISPDDDPSAIATVLGAAEGDLAVVGHEPHLGVLASLMVHGPERSGIYYPFPKASVLALSRDGRRWKSEWLVRSP
jgi:phosphohistidine phosphatase